MNMISTLSKKKRALTLCVAISALMYSAPSFAQAPDASTTTADPGRLQQQLRPSETMRPLSAKVEVKDVILQNVPAGAENINLELRTVELEGVTAYETGELEAVYANKLGTTLTLADVYGIASSLTTKYRNDGYILTQVVIPPQTIDDGVVKFRVVEGFIGSISVEGAGDQESAIALIRRYANEIETNQALNIEDLERHLLIISDLPGVEARSVLSPSRTTPGAADLRILVSRDAYDAFLAVDNYGSRYLGPVQFTASGSANSFFGNNERITAQIVAAPDPGSNAPGALELGYVALSYAQPLPVLGTGTNVELFASHTDTEPGFDLASAEVKGRSQFMSAKVSHPFIRSRSTNLIGHALFDWRDVSSRNNLQDTLRDRIRAVRVGGVYQVMDTIFGVGVNSLALELSQGVNVFGATSKGDANITRTLGDPKFTKLTGDIQRLQRVAPKVNLLVAAKGQWASGPLLSSEEFGVGGISFGRGYDSSEIVGDEGVAGKAEIQWNNPYPTDILNDYQLFGFYDAGRIWNKDPTTSSQKKQILTSTGVGVRAEFLNEINTDVFLAVPLNREVQTQGDQGARFFFNVSRAF